MQRKIEDIKINSKKNTKKTFGMDVDFSRSNNFDSFPKIKRDSLLKDKYNKENDVDNKKTVKSYPVFINKKKKINFLSVFFIMILFFGGFYFSSIFFEKTTIDIENKKENFSLENKSFRLSKDSEQGVSFEVMIVEGEDYKNMELKEKTEASVKAKGEIILFNEYNLNQEKISKGTHITDDKGRLYVIDNDIFIPGYTNDEKGNINPGKVSVGITSFLAGDSYNGEASIFNINNFKNTPKNNKIYGKMKTPLKGGVSGSVYTLDSNDRGVLISYIENTFKNNLIRKTKAQIPEGYVLYPNAVTFDYNLSEELFFKENIAQVPFSGSVSVVIIKEPDFKRAIIKSLLPKVSKSELSEIEILKTDDLIFSFVNKDEIVTKDLLQADFTLKGDVSMVWNPDILSLPVKLLGVDKNNVVSVLKNDPGIDNASVKIFPPWSSSLPLEVSKIKINIK